MKGGRKEGREEEALYQRQNHAILGESDRMEWVDR